MSVARSAHEAKGDQRVQRPPEGFAADVEARRISVPRGLLRVELGQHGHRPAVARVVPITSESVVEFAFDTKVILV